MTLPPLPHIPQPYQSGIVALANAAVILGAVGCLVFVIFYHRLSRWRESALGRNVMWFMACMLLLVFVGFVRAFLDWWLDAWLDLLRLAAYGITVAVVWHRVYLLLRYQLREDRPITGPPVAERARPVEDTPPEGVRTPRE